MKKKICSFMLVMAVMTILAPSFGVKWKEVHAESYTIDGFEIEDGVLVSYNGGETNLVIPDDVTRIGDEALRGNTGIISVTIPDTVTVIGSNAFQNCSSLKTVNMSDSVTEIILGNENNCRIY